MNFALAEMPLPLRFRPETPMSDDELMRFCAANDALRVERDANGEILVMTPAGNTTGRKNAYLIQVLGNWSDADGRGYAFDSNTGFTLPDGSMRSPDAAWIRADRWDALNENDKDSFSHICPDFIIELRSPSDNLAELEAKMEQWTANGAQVAWLIDPERQVVAIYRPGDQPEVFQHPASVQGNGIVAGFELVMARIWS
jgi:Uma2 family endonuclease